MRASHQIGWAVAMDWGMDQAACETAGHALPLIFKTTALPLEEGCTLASFYMCSSVNSPPGHRME